MDDASVRRVVQIDALPEGDGVVFVLESRPGGSIPLDWRVAELRGCFDEG